MEPIRRILCPTDFSETSAKAVQYAERLATGTGAELILLHAFRVPETYDAEGQKHPGDRRIEEKLDALEFSCPEVKVARVLHAGEPGEVICWMAQDRDCDVIVMGTHGRTGLRHLVFGSTAEYVVQHARCPVLTVRDRPADEPPLSEPLVMPLPAPRLM